MTRWRLLTGPLLAVLVGALLLAHTYVAAMDIQSQFKRVEVMEQSHRLYESDMADTFDKNPAVVSFANDPVFTTPQWRSVLDENRKAMSSAGALEPKTFGIWWPGLEKRAEAALPTVYDHSEFVTAAGMALSTCSDKALTADQRIVQWRERYGQAADPKLKSDPYWQAKLAVMPDIIRAGTKYFCGQDPLKF